MGDIADYYLDSLIDAEEDLEEERWKNFAAKKWLTKDGKLLKIKDMETSHIANTISFIKKEGFLDDLGQNYITLFEKELKIREDK